ncbi:hypothetical protein IEO21_00858 [Rhodonia placenta]|uniref:Uncharacterized protein n=1 Tax=Rhodonia placenta TaxID=104341 RepID=A0A8H7PB80_9APHY|nr:hypothetical protein IEO21_00858 [Postia placenta]
MSICISCTGHKWWIGLMRDRNTMEKSRCATGPRSTRRGPG